MLDLDLDKLLPRPLQFAILGAVAVVGFAAAAQHIATTQIEPIASALEAHKQAHEDERKILFQKLDDLQAAVTQLEIHLAAISATQEEDHRR